MKGILGAYGLKATIHYNPQFKLNTLMDKEGYAEAERMERWKE